MGINQLVDAYKGNPAPLQARVQQAQKNQPPGAIPPDLEEAIALQKITEMRNSAQNQQAMQAGGAQPSVVEKLRQMLGAEQRQQAQPPQMPQGGPQMSPQAPQGVDALPTNVGQQYAEGGIIGKTRHFDNGDLVVDPMGGVIQGSSSSSNDDRSLLERIGIFNPENRRAIERAEREKREREAEEIRRQALGLKPGEVERGRQPDPRSAANRFPSAQEQLNEAAVFEAQRQPRVNVAAGSGGSGGGGAAASKASLIDELVSQGLITKPGNTDAYKKMAGVMNLDADAEETKAINKFKQQVGDKDLSIYDQMAAELKARKERLNAPAKGYDALMEYLGQIAQSGGGRSWMESGAKGAAGLNALQKSRQDQQDALVEKILDLGAKKKEAEYAQKEKMYDIGQARYKDVFKNAFEAAKDVNKSDDEARKIAIEAVLRQKEMDNKLQTARMGASDNLMSRAKALMAVDNTLTLEQAMTKAASIAATGQLGAADSRAETALANRIEAIKKEYPLLKVLPPDNPMYQQQKKLMDERIAEARGQAGKGLDALPTSTPKPAGVTVTQVSK